MGGIDGRGILNFLIVFNLFFGFQKKRLICCGSSVFLKNRFGVGYNLSSNSLI